MIRRHHLALALAALPLLAACDAGSPVGNLASGLGLPGAEPPPPPEPEPLPPAVQRALPPGTPPSIVMTDNTGCYIFSIERTDPPSGYYVRDENGNPICEGGVPAPAVAEPGAASDATVEL